MPTNITNDSKADQYVYDENYDYINNRDKKTTVAPIRPVKVHEMFEAATGRNIYGPFNALIMNLIDAIKAQVKLDNYDESKYEEATYKAFFDTFAESGLAMIKSKFDNFGQGDGTRQYATKETFIRYQNNPNYSGGPIAGKNYDEDSKEESGLSSLQTMLDTLKAAITAFNAGDKTDPSAVNSAITAVDNAIAALSDSDKAKVSNWDSAKATLGTVTAGNAISEETITAVNAVTIA